MAQTTRTYVGTGSPKVYDVDFDLGYLSRSHIFVYTGDDYTMNQIPFMWINAGQIQCTVPAAEEFIVRRITPRNALVNDYTDGAILRELNLDDSFLQSLMILEEIADGYIVTDGPFVVNSDIDMMLHKIVNLKDATDDNDAINLGQVIALLATLDASGGSVISDVPPPLVIEGQRWTRCADMKSFIWYDDGDSAQWVEDNPSYGYTVTTGATGTFVSADTKTITVVDGLITSII